jgi:hypothetical protein
MNYDIQAGHSIFAHSRPDKIGTPRLLPLYIRNIFNGISAKKSAQILCLPFLFEFVSKVTKVLIPMYIWIHNICIIGCIFRVKNY